MHIQRKSRWRPPPFLILKICCHFFPIGPILTKFGENVENLTSNATVGSKCIFSNNQDGVRRHLEFRKTVAISLLSDRSAPNLVGMLKILPRTQLSYRNCIFNENQDGGRRHPDFRKSVAISLLLDRSSPNLVGMLLTVDELHCIH